MSDSVSCGGCQCGSIRYELSRSTFELYVCRHQRRGTAETISVKGGSLDEPVDLRRAVHIWTSRMLQGIVVPEGAAQFPGEPE